MLTKFLNINSRCLKTICIIDLETVEELIENNEVKEKIYYAGVLILNPGLYKVIEYQNLTVEEILYYMKKNNFQMRTKQNYLNKLIFNSFKIFSFNNQDEEKILNEMLEYLFNANIQMGYNYSQLFVYSLNGSKFDHYILFDYFTKYTKDLKFDNVIESNKFYCFTIKRKFNNKYKQIKFRDISNIIPGSLHNLCEAFNIPLKYRKRNFNIEEYRQKYKNNHLSIKDQEELKKYLIADLLSTYLIVIKTSEILYNEFNIFIQRCTTIGNISINILKKYLKSQKIIIPISCSIRLNNYIREALYGGRVYCLKPFSQNIIEYDVNSLYPAAMLDNYFPTSKPIVIDINKCNNTTIIKLLTENKLFICTVTIETNKKLKISPIPIIDKRDNNIYRTYNYKFQKIITLTINSVDLKELMNIGYKIKKVLTIVKFNKSKKIFHQYIETIYDKRIKSKEKIISDFYKLIMNNTYGKLCQKPNETKIIIKKHNTKYRYKKSDYKNIYKINKYNYDIYRINLIENFKFPIQIASFITAYSRQIMNKFIHKLGGFENPKFYYSDTDSFYINNYDKKLILEKIDKVKIGYLRQVNEYIKGVFAGSKIKALKQQNGNEKITFRGFNTNKITYEQIENYTKSKGKKTLFTWENQFNRSLIFSVSINKILKTSTTFGPCKSKINLKKNTWDY